MNNKNEISPIKSIFMATVVDAGARYGLHPTWAEYEDIFDFSLFEVDPNEAVRLSKKYEKKENITVHNTALSDQVGSLTFLMRKHKALNSRLEPNSELIESDNYKIEEQEIIGSFDVNASTLDILFSDQSVDFLKLDVEGDELNVLSGTENQLKDSILAIRSEVFFAPVIQGAPMFGDLNSVLTQHGFVFLSQE
jgi:FkbM family methyltransferase